MEMLSRNNFFLFFFICLQPKHSLSSAFRSR